MTWFKVDDGLALHPKAIEAGNSALGLWVRAGAWCASQLTDGRLPGAMLAPLGGRARDADRLVKAGLWWQTENGYEFRDWTDYQPTRVQVRAERDAAKERQRRHREQRNNGVTDGVTTPVTNAVSHSAPSRPVPSRSGLGSQSLDARTDNGTSDGPDLERIARALKSDTRRANAVADQILTKAPRPPANPTSYILGAIGREPHLYRETNGPPPLGALCDEHGRDRAGCPPTWHQEQP